MNAAQEEALEKITQLIREHFEHGVVSVMTVDELSNQEIRDTRWHGGGITAIGLLKVAYKRLVKAYVSDSK